MNYAIHRISLDINDDSPSQLVLSARQGDSAKLLIVSLLADKHTYIIEGDCYATFVGKKASGTVFEHECTIDLKNNKIEYPFQPMTVSTTGRVDCEINLFNADGERLTTARFTIVVYESLFSSSVSDKEEDVTEATRLRAELNGLVNSVEEKLANGEFVGEKGDKGDKGEKGDPGDANLEDLNEIYSNALKGYAGGTAIRIDDLSPLSDSVEVNVSGVSNPESVTVTRFGKNLINPQYFIDAHPEVLTSGYTRRGVTIKYIPDDDCWELNGSAEASVDQYGVQLVPNKFGFGNVKGKYITGSVEYVSGNIIGEPDEDTIGSNVSIGFSNNADGTGYGAHLVFDIKTTNTQKTATAYSDYYVLYWLAINRGQTFQNFRFRLQLEIGDTVTEYEKCTQESFTPDSNGNFEITGLRPTTTLLTNNASVYLLANYTRDINAAINGTTETQQLATVDYVNDALTKVSPKLYKHLFNLSGSIGGDIAEVSLCFEIIDSLETVIFDWTAYNPMNTLRTYLVDKYGVNKAIPVSGYAAIVADDTINLIYFPALSIVADDSKVSVNYITNGQSLSASLNQIAPYGDTFETIIEI